MRFSLRSLILATAVLALALAAFWVVGVLVAGVLLAIEVRARWDERSRANSIVCGTIGICIAVLIMLVLIPLASDPREAARRSTCKGNLSYLALALQDYHTR